MVVRSGRSRSFSELLLTTKSPPIAIRFGAEKTAIKLSYITRSEVVSERDEISI